MRDLPYTIHKPEDPGRPDRPGTMTAACEHLEDAAALIAALGDGHTIHLRGGLLLWDEGAEKQPAAESYDFVAETGLSRVGKNPQNLPRMRFPLCAYLNPQGDGEHDHDDEPRDEVWLEWSDAHLRIILGPYGEESPDIFIERQRDPRKNFPAWAIAVHPGDGLDAFGSLELSRVNGGPDVDDTLYCQWVPEINGGETIDLDKYQY